MWTSVSDLALMTHKMKVIPALPAECQVEALKRIWSSLRWVPQWTELHAAQDPVDRLIVIAQGEAEVILGHTSYVPVLPAGTYVCEAALLGQSWSWKGLNGKYAQHFRILERARILPSGPLKVLETFLSRELAAPKSCMKLRTTRRSLVGELTGTALWDILRKVHGGLSPKQLSELPARCNALQNITAIGARAQLLGREDVSALRVVCEGSLNVSCEGAAPAVRRLATAGFLGFCKGRGSLQEEPVERVAEEVPSEPPSRTHVEPLVTPVRVASGDVEEGGLGNPIFGQQGL